MTSQIDSIQLQKTQNTAQKHANSIRTPSTNQSEKYSCFDARRYIEPSNFAIKSDSIKNNDDSSDIQPIIEETSPVIVSKLSQAWADYQEKLYDQSYQALSETLNRLDPNALLAFDITYMIGRVLIEKDLDQAFEIFEKLLIFNTDEPSY